MIQDPYARSTSEAGLSKHPSTDYAPSRTLSMSADFDGTVLDASLSLSSIEGNNNKYYYIQLLAPKDGSAKYALWTHWGRVGESGQRKLEQNLVLESAMSSSSRKFKDKTGLTWDKRYGAPKANKYTLIEKSYNDDPDDALEKIGNTSEKGKALEDKPSACMLSPELQDLENSMLLYRCGTRD